MTVAHTLPASRETGENNAPPNASPSPTSASRNFTHTSADEDCSHCASRPGVPGPGVSDFNGLAYAETTHFEPSILPANRQSRSPGAKSVRNWPGCEISAGCPISRAHLAREVGISSSFDSPDSVLPCLPVTVWAPNLIL